MDLGWFNVVRFMMLFLALFLNEIMFLNVWHGSNFSLVAVAVAYYIVAIWLSLWGGSHRPQRG